MSGENDNWTEAAANKLDKLHLQQLLAGKMAEISFLIETLSMQTQRAYKFEKANADLLEELEKKIAEIQKREREIEELEAELIPQNQLIQKLYLARRKLADVRKILDNVPSCFEPNPGSIKALLLRALEGEDEGGEPDPLHVKLEKEIQDRNPPLLRKGGNGEKPKPPAKEEAPVTKTEGGG